MADFEVTGAETFLRLSKALKHAGRTELRKELHNGISRAARPLIPKTRQAAKQRLPRRGGLADQVAKEPMRVRVRTGKDPGVRIVVGKRRGAARAANKGLIRHPVFGNKEVFVDQKVPPGWFDEPIQRDIPKIRREVVGSMQDVVDKIVRDARG